MPFLLTFSGCAINIDLTKYATQNQNGYIISASGIKPIEIIVEIDNRGDTNTPACYTRARDENKNIHFEEREIYKGGPWERDPYLRTLTPDELINLYVDTRLKYIKQREAMRQEDKRKQNLNK